MPLPSRWPAAGLKLLTGLAALGLCLVSGISGTQDAAANGDTRSIPLYNQRTQEVASITFRRNGSYDSAALKQLDWLCRDWRTDEPTRMDPKLFDILWQVYREVGASEPIEVLSAYRSPGTNAMLRRRSRAVSEHSQHMRGKALDFRIGGVSMSRVREIAMRLQEGGVGFYPGAQFVHLDAGSVRSWPRMSGGELARLFPDGRTVHIPRDGKPLQGYEEAKAVILARGGSVAGYAAYAEGEETGGRGKSLWAMLFGGGDDEDSDFYRSTASRTRAAPGRPSPGTQVAAYAPSSSDDAGQRSFFGGAAPGPEEPSTARRAGRTQVAALDRTAVAAVSPPPGLEPPSASPSTAGLDLPPRGAAGDAARPLDAAPMPPRRPAEIAPLLVEAPTPPVRPTTVAAVGGSAPVLPNELRGEMRNGGRAAVPADDRAALRSLFEAAATPTVPARRADVPTSRVRPAPLAPDGVVAGPAARVRTVFSSASADEPSPAAFSGPAVAPLSVLR